MKLLRADAGDRGPLALWKLPLVEAQGDEAVELSLEVDQRAKGCEGPGEPKELSEVVLLPVPVQRVSREGVCLRRKPSRGTSLYQSGTVSLCRERCTRSWCSDITRSVFCSSFSGGCNKNIDLKKC